MFSNKEKKAIQVDGPITGRECVCVGEGGGGGGGGL